MKSATSSLGRADGKRCRIRIAERSRTEWLGSSRTFSASAGPGLLARRESSDPSDTAARTACTTLAAWMSVISQVSLEPSHPAAYPDAVNAVRHADLIVVGPGSLFTSVLPNLLVPDLRIAFQESTAMKIYVSNVATQHGETDHFSVQDHLVAIEYHVGGSPFHFVVANDNMIEHLPERWHSEVVRVTPGAVLPKGCRLVTADVVDLANRYRHDPGKLADVLLTLYHEKGEAAPRSEEPIRLFAGG